MKGEIKEGIILTVSILIIIAFVYFITATIKTGEIGGKKETTTKSDAVTELYDNMILAKDTFSKANTEYMVIFFSEKDVVDSIRAIMKSYSGDTKLYKVNLDEKVNSYIVSEEENMYATNAGELKIKGTTLIKINNGTIKEYITDKKQILEQLQ